MLAGFHLQEYPKKTHHGVSCADAAVPTDGKAYE